jgi:D-alanyl-lipoteichoic acid acyltransferase DltB (MBOAT superfamily)
VLFHSYPFIGLFLPITLIGFFLIATRSHAFAALWLGLASLFFYGWWNPKYVPLLLASIAFNFLVARAIGRQRERGRMDRAKLLLAFGIVCDLGLLFYYKYTDFFLATLNRGLATELPLLNLVLPLGISFFTFTQIAFLVDTYRGEAKEYNPIHYLFFVTNYPHLIAGPILHHKEIMPQFENPACYRVNWEDVSVGLTIFVIGLVKKVLIADSIAVHVAPVFDEAKSPHFFLAWGGALAYTLQLYFDFSGYSDMAIGLARMFGVKFPLNFDSPYKAQNIVEFWRRWHMTLSRFLRDYLYIPLGGNRHGRLRRYVNLMTTMVLGGLWHGAGWTFVVWGALHGFYLVVNHAWQALRGGEQAAAARKPTSWAWLLTFLAVIVGWVFFRSKDLDTAFDVLRGMAGLNGFVLPEHWFKAPSMAGVKDWLLAAGATTAPIKFTAYRDQVYLTLELVLIATLAPNTQQIMQRFKPTIDRFKPLAGALARWTWQPNLAWLSVMTVLFVWALLEIPRGDKVSEFLYFQF